MTETPILRIIPGREDQQVSLTGVYLITDQQDHLVEKAKTTGLVMADMLAELVERHPCVGDVRSIGLFGAVELVKDKTGKPVNVKITNNQGFVEQMLYYGKKYGTL